MDLTYISDPKTRRKKVECKPELIISSLQKFYSSRPDIQKIIPYLNGEAEISLRIIDWFVTKFSRKNFIRYILNGQDFLVYLSYKGQLRAYSKQYFDPNCRRERIMFKIPNHSAFLTTIGKLKFFSWALENKVIDYIEENIDIIRDGYNIYLKENIYLHNKRTTSSSNSSDSSITSTESITTITSVPTTTTSINQMRHTRCRMKQIPSSLRQLQITPNENIRLEFS